MATGGSAAKQTIGGGAGCMRGKIVGKEDTVNTSIGYKTLRLMVKTVQRLFTGRASPRFCLEDAGIGNYVSA